MPNYLRMYRFGFTPWERYAEVAAASVAVLLDREESERSRPLGRALDLGCGRGRYALELARRGWEVTGVDNVPAAIDAAKRNGNDDVTYVVGDVTDLDSAELGTFDFFLDIGCFQNFDAVQRAGEGRGVLTLANPGATLLMMAFGRTRMRALLGGVSREDVVTAFPEWELVAVDRAQTNGLGWPMNRTGPQWYRLRLETPRSPVVKF